MTLQWGLWSSPVQVCLIDFNWTWAGSPTPQKQGDIIGMMNTHLTLQELVVAKSYPPPKKKWTIVSWARMSQMDQVIKFHGSKPPTRKHYRRIILTGIIGVHGQYLVYSSKSSIFEECIIVFQVLVYNKCYRFLMSVLSFSKPQLNFQKIETARILLSINSYVKLPVEGTIPA